MKGIQLTFVKDVGKTVVSMRELCNGTPKSYLTVRGRIEKIQKQLEKVDPLLYEEEDGGNCYYFLTARQMQIYADTYCSIDVDNEFLRVTSIRFALGAIETRDSMLAKAFFQRRLELGLV